MLDRFLVVVLRHIGDNHVCTSARERNRSARPMPLAAPVTNATFLSKRPFSVPTTIASLLSFLQV